MGERDSPPQNRVRGERRTDVGGQRAPGGPAGAEGRPRGPGAQTPAEGRGPDGGSCGHVVAAARERPERSGGRYPVSCALGSCAPRPGAEAGRRVRRSGAGPGRRRAPGGSRAATGWQPRPTLRPVRPACAPGLSQEPGPHPSDLLPGSPAPGPMGPLPAARRMLDIPALLEGPPLGRPHPHSRSKPENSGPPGASLQLPTGHR